MSSDYEYSDDDDYYDGDDMDTQEDGASSQQLSSPCSDRN